jgi:hypothetical protein
MSYLAAKIMVENFPFPMDAMNEEDDKIPGMHFRNTVIPLPILHKNIQTSLTFLIHTRNFATQFSKLLKHQPK